MHACVCVYVCMINICLPHQEACLLSHVVSLSSAVVCVGVNTSDLIDTDIVREVSLGDTQVGVAFAVFGSILVLFPQSGLKRVPGRKEQM